MLLRNSNKLLTITLIVLVLLASTSIIMYAGQTSFASNNEKGYSLSYIPISKSNFLNPYSFDSLGFLNIVDANKKNTNTFLNSDMVAYYDFKMNERFKKMNEEKRHFEEERRKQQELSRSAVNRGSLFTLTAYDLSEQSCGKSTSHPSYGITATGRDLSGQSWESARAIAVDPRVIPLGSKVYIKFVNEKYSYMDGHYTAVDTGGAIKGNHIDFFMGEHAKKEAMSFGHQKAYIIIE